jgi:hypothetical protein
MMLDEILACRASKKYQSATFAYIANFGDLS